MKGSLAVLLLEQVIDFPILARKLLQIVHSVMMYWTAHETVQDKEAENDL